MSENSDAKIINNGDNNPKINKYSKWCKEMSEKSSDGKEAYNYYQLQQFWLGRGL